MAEVVSMIRTDVTTPIENVTERIKRDIGAELITDTRVELGEGKKAIFLGFEEYYFRVSNYVTLSIMLTDDQNVQTATIMGAGGGSGIFNFSWGANRSFARNGEEVLSSLGFRRK